MRLLLPLLGLACSTLALAQAVVPVPAMAPSPPGFPAPAYTPAGAGAPVLGQPGQQSRPPVSRSPNTRELPPTAEPGFWAADEVRAVRRPIPAAPDVDEVLRSQPSQGTPTLASCRERVRRAARDSGLEDVRRGLATSVRDCLTARLLLECFYREQVEFKERLEVTPKTPEANAMADRNAKESVEVLRWQERVCEGFLSRPHIEELRATIQAHLERQFRRPGSGR